MRLLRLVAALGILIGPAGAQNTRLPDTIPWWKTIPKGTIVVVVLAGTASVVGAVKAAGIADKKKTPGIPDRWKTDIPYKPTIGIPDKKLIGLPPATVPEDLEPTPDSADGTAPEEHEVEGRERVFYATDRLRRASRNHLGRFSGRRDPDQNLHYGVCWVSMPKGHDRGSHERPGFLRKENYRKHIVFYRLLELDHPQWLQHLRKAIGDSPQSEALVFLHGYKVTFAAAVRRTAQLAYDLEFRGPVIAYSWPSRGTLRGYSTDSQSARNTADNLRRVLEDVCQNTGAKTVHVIAHSMGNVPLANVLARLDREIGHIVLAAPDIDVTEFKNLAAQFPGNADRITLYASSKDRALKLSKRMQGYPRVGDTSDGVLVVDGVDTIDASAVDTSFTGHSYVGSNQSVVEDLYKLLHDGKETADRLGMIPHKAGDRDYWKYDPKKVKPRA